MVLGSGRVTGALLLFAGLAIGLGGTAWVLVAAGSSGGKVLGIVLLLILVLPLVSGGVFLLFKGQAEAKDYAEVQKQRMVLNMVETRGKVRIADIALEIQGTRDQVQKYIYDLVGKGLFTGYVNWQKGELLAVDARQLNESQTCPNCGGKLELAGKGLVQCPFCGSEIFLSPSGR
jgi:DNA-directed RNA polymerase subunit RPC12/RpoP